MKRFESCREPTPGSRPNTTAGAGPARQMGIVLISTLIFLLVITLFSLFSIRRVTLQEKAVGNLMDRQMAFQAADLAVRYGEDVAVDNSTNEELLKFTANCNVSASDLSLRGLCRSLPANYWRTYNWSATNSREVWDETGVTFEKFAEKPRFYVEYLGNNKLVRMHQLGSEGGAKMFRIVGRGTGLTGDSSVMIEEIIAVPPPK